MTTENRRQNMPQDMDLEIQYRSTKDFLELAYVGLIGPPKS